MNSPLRPSPALTDSGWFWLTVFGVAGILGLVLISPKFSERQARIERMHVSRQTARQAVAEEAGYITRMPADKHEQNNQTDASSSSRLIVNLIPLAVVLAFLVVLGVALSMRKCCSHRPDLPAAQEKTA